MEKKRTKLWRREQGFRVFKARLKYYVAGMDVCVMDDGRRVYRPQWFELAKCHWAQVYKTTRTPCSCWMCRGYEYSRLDYKKETLRIINETME